MSIIIAFIIGIVCGVILCAVLDCIYGLGKRAGREDAIAETEARTIEQSHAEDPYSLLRGWRACMAGTRPSDWEQIVSHLLEDTDTALANADATALETDAGGRAGSVCSAGVDVLASGYAVEVCLWRLVPERREITRRRKFSSFFRKS